MYKIKEYFDRLLYPTKLKRVGFFFLSDILIIASSLYLAFNLRFEFAVSDEYKAMLINALPLFIAVKIFAFLVFRIYRMTWRYVSINDLSNIIGAIITAECVLIVLILSPFNAFLQFLQLPRFAGFPRSIFLIDGFVSLLLISALRISKRLYTEVLQKRGRSTTGKRTIIIGAGNTGEMIIRDIARQGISEFYPIGLLDDDKRKIGTYVHGVKVLDTTDKLKDTIIKHRADAVIIAIPSLDYKTLRSVYSSAKDSAIKTIKIVPRIYDFQKPDINLKNLEDIKFEDLIGRQEVNIDYNEIEKFLGSKVILITGACGSIGSELTLQTCAFQPERVILFDMNETELHNTGLKLKRTFPHLYDRLSFVIGDIKDVDKVEEVFREFRPDIVFHAAAYKHVSMMENNPKEAVKTNIFGTYFVANAAFKHGVKKFIMISTDKAVNPTSIMGASKRIAEYICKAFDGTGDSEFVSVRFGNVLGSRGSVLPLFLEQLKNGGPLTVTHKDVQRFFMTIPEAVSLVLQASALGKSGDVLILDMGEPVKIVTVAEELIMIHGLKPYKDIDIEFIGLRPGEKLNEELLTVEEKTEASKHNKIFIARSNEKFSKKEIESILQEFEVALKESPMNEAKGIRNLFNKYVKHFSESLQ